MSAQAEPGSGSSDSRVDHLKKSPVKEHGDSFTKRDQPGQRPGLFRMPEGRMQENRD